MKLNRFLLTAGALAMCGTLAFAQDFDDFGDFGDFGGSDDAFGSSSSKLEVNGSVSLDVRAYVDVDDADDLKVDAAPDGTIELSYSGNKADAILLLNVNADRIQNHPEDVIDELVLRGYFGNLTLEAGKMKVVWGKGDKLHVIDNFNADDYSDFIIPDYLDRRISTPMIRGVYSLPFSNMNLEAVYTPFLPVDRFATDGKWTPAQVASLTSAVRGNATQKVASAFTRYTTDTATAGTLATLNADYLAAQNAYHTAMITAAATSVVKEQAGDTWDGMTDEQKSAAIQNVIATNGTALETAISTNKTALESGLRSVGSGYYIDNLAVAQATYEAACAETGFDADSIKTELEAAGEAYMLALTYANALSADPDVIYPELWSLKYGQFGVRTTFTVGQVDLGMSYYNGWYKQPSFNASKLDSFITTYLSKGSVSDDDKFLAYDKKQTFGLEASSIIWHFNVRGEFAYNLTNDVDGTDPWVHNNSIAWLGGFDIDLPFWNANLNVQEYGTFVLHGSDCDDNTALWAAYGAADVDYAKNGYSNNKIVCNFTTSFLNDKIAPEVTVMYGIENGDLVVMPKLAYKPDQNLTLSASGMWILCRDNDSEFASWKKNSFVSLGASYQF